jgi:hypothetical protein
MNDIVSLTSFSDFSFLVHRYAIDFFYFDFVSCYLAKHVYEIKEFSGSFRHKIISSPNRDILLLPSPLEFL